MMIHTIRRDFIQAVAGRTLTGLLLVSAFVSSFCLPAYGSSLWAAAGNSVQGGGVLVGKNYDGQPVHCELRMVIPGKGIAYLGLFPLNSKKGQGPLAGINEKGLAVVSAAPATLSGAGMSPSAERITEKLLTGFETVDSLLSARGVFRKGFPVFYVIADRRKIALIEVPPHGESAVKATDSGAIVHTDHYITEQLLSLNKKVHRSSELRLERIGRSLNAVSGPLTIDDFINVSKDKGESPEEAVLRLGGPSGTERTLAGWVLSLPKSGPPELYTAIFGADETAKEYGFKLDQPFWTEGVE